VDRVQYWIAAGSDHAVCGPGGRLDPGCHIWPRRLRIGPYGEYNANADANANRDTDTGRNADTGRDTDTGRNADTGRDADADRDADPRFITNTDASPNSDTNARLCSER